ncbi:hypothetical protein JCM10207_007141 [Rhodosporidiobolus poonsookiae]
MADDDGADNSGPPAVAGLRAADERPAHIAIEMGDGSYNDFYYLLTNHPAYEDVEEPSLSLESRIRRITHNDQIRFRLLATWFSQDRRRVKDVRNDVEDLRNDVANNHEVAKRWFQDSRVLTYLATVSSSGVGAIAGSRAAVALSSVYTGKPVDLKVDGWLSLASALGSLLGGGLGPLVWQHRGALCACFRRNKGARQE